MEVCLLAGIRTTVQGTTEQQYNFLLEGAMNAVYYYPLLYIRAANGQILANKLLTPF